MKLVQNARHAWRWFSVQAFTALGVLPLVWSELPDDVRSMLPEEYRPWVLVALAGSGLIGRLVDQGGGDA